MSPICYGEAVPYESSLTQFVVVAMKSQKLWNLGLSLAGHASEISLALLHSDLTQEHLGSLESLFFCFSLS